MDGVSLHGRLNKPHFTLTTLKNTNTIIKCSTKMNCILLFGNIKWFI